MRTLFPKKHGRRDLLFVGAPKLSFSSSPKPPATLKLRSGRGRTTSEIGVPYRFSRSPTPTPPSPDSWFMLRRDRAHAHFPQNGRPLARPSAPEPSTPGPDKVQNSVRHPTAASRPMRG